MGRMYSSVYRRRKKLTIIGVGIVVFILLFQYSSLWSSDTKKSELPAPFVDFNSDYFGLGLDRPTEEPRRRPVLELIAQIHVKNIPDPRVEEHQSDAEAEENFFKYLENKQVSCNSHLRLGHPHDGGWNVCMSPPMGFSGNCLVYSFGIGLSWQFEDAVSKVYGCEVMAFDPSLPIPEEDRSELIHFYKVGLAAEETVPGGAAFQAKPLRSHFRDHGHEKSIINYLKFDLEGAEWSVLDAMVADGSLRNVKQIGFEIHSQELFKASKLGKPVNRKDFVQMFVRLRSLEAIGFKKFNYRRNPFGEYKSVFTKKSRSCCYELNYINMNFLQSNETIVHYKDAERFH